MNKGKVFTLIVLFATLVVLLLIPAKASARPAYVPGHRADPGPGGLPACACDFTPAECWCIK